MVQPLWKAVVTAYKIKHTLTIQSCNHAPWVLPKGSEELCPHKNLNTDIYSSFIHNYHNLEATKMYLVGDVSHEQTGTSNGILFSDKKK